MVYLERTQVFGLPGSLINEEDAVFGTTRWTTFEGDVVKLVHLLMWRGQLSVKGTEEACRWIL